MNILIVDDEPDFAEFVADVAESLDHDCAIATEGEELAQRLDLPIDLVFLDIFMPGMDGIEVLRKIADRDVKPAIALMSGKDSSVLNSAREIAEERGLSVITTLRKPFLFSDIEEVLQKCESRVAPRRQPVNSQITPDDIQAGLELGEFWVAYQPQTDISTGKLVGAEALIRWESTEKGPVGPSLFIPLIENTDLIVPVTNFVIEQVARDFEELKMAGVPNISINLSPRFIFDLDFPETLGEALRHFHMAPENLTLEVTETSARSDVARSIDILTRLRMKGHPLSIDDFGTGYSSLEQLVRIPFTELKIDQRFISDLPSNPNSKAAAEICTLLGQKLGMHVVAEGVEDAATLKELQLMGADIAQGYGICRPNAKDVICDWAKAYVDEHSKNRQEL